MKVKYSNKELLEIFRVKGFYYSIDNILCRSHLVIEKIHHGTGMNFVSIMMNPGKSWPKDDLEDGYCETEPDKTQYQLMKLMLSTNIKRLHVINLSDIREPSSKEFYKKIKHLEEALKYSIFSNNRKNELKRVFLDVDGVICAWGVNGSLGALSNLALKTVQGMTLYGIRKGEGSGYYHPLPRINSLGWLKTMRCQIIKKVKQDNQFYPFVG